MKHGNRIQGSICVVFYGNCYLPLWLLLSSSHFIQKIQPNGHLANQNVYLVHRRNYSMATQCLHTGFRSGNGYYPWIPSLPNYILIFITKIDYTQWHPLCSQNKNINGSIIQNGSGLKGNCNHNHNPRFIWTRSFLLWAIPQERNYMLY